MKNKILTISIIFILLSFIFINNNVFAASYDLSDYSNHVGSKKWVIIYIVAKDEFQLITTEKAYLYGNSVHLEENGYSWIDSTVLCAKNLTTNPWGDSGNYVQIYKFNNSTNTFNYSHETRFYDISEAYIIATNTTLYNATNHSIFFQQTPVPSQVVVPWETPTTTPTLEEIMNKAGEQATLEVGQIILIVIAITAGLMVLLIGLKKGLTVLMNGFRH